MKFYQDITLLPDEEANIGFLWQKVYQKIHIALAENKIEENESSIALSFPNYGKEKFPLGSKLRLFSSTKEQLQTLDISRQLNRLSDYCHWTSIKEVPEVNKYAVFSRKQFKTNIERRARRRIKSTGESLKDTISYLEKKGFKDKSSNLPYINLESSKKPENNHKKCIFRLFIDRTLLDKPEGGAFNCYGLSKTATVPWF